MVSLSNVEVEPSASRGAVDFLSVGAPQESSEPQGLRSRASAATSLDDPLSAARGIAVGVLVGLVAWALIIGSVVRLIDRLT